MKHKTSKGKHSGQICQLEHIPAIGDKVSLMGIFFQKFRKIIHGLRKRIRRIPPLLGCRVLIPPTSRLDNEFEVGEIIRVRPKQEIESLLKGRNELKGCSWMPQMWQYCGTEQKVYKRVKRFLDERDYLVKRCKGIYLLEGVFCGGVDDLGGCDRSCFFFWRKEWLQPIFKNK